MDQPTKPEAETKVTSRLDFWKGALEEWREWMASDLALENIEEFGIELSALEAELAELKEAGEVVEEKELASLGLQLSEAKAQWCTIFSLLKATDQIKEPVENVASEDDLLTRFLASTQGQVVSADYTTTSYASGLDADFGLGPDSSLISSQLKLITGECSAKSKSLENYGNTESPENSGNTESPENSGNTESPENSGNTESPENSGNTESPENSGNTVCLADSSIFEKVELPQSSQKMEFQSSMSRKKRALPDTFKDYEKMVKEKEAKYRKGRTMSSFALSNTNSETTKAEVIDNYTIKITRTTYKQASVLLLTRNTELRNCKWKLTVKKLSTTTGLVSGNEMQEYVGRFTHFDFPLAFQAGHSYRVTVIPVELSDGRECPEHIMEQTADFRAVFTKEDLKELHEMAIRYASGSNSMCKVLYRTKAPQYFKEIKDNHNNMMDVYIKDNSGDQASPINLLIKGTFFMASVEPGTNGEPVRVSPFGSRRISIPAEEMLALVPNVFFTDFYCMKSNIHQVTLVLTKSGSEADTYCVQHLLPLNLKDPTENPFLFFDASGQLHVSTKRRLVIELLVTENLDIGKYRLTEVQVVGKGFSTPGGVPKNATCSVCNLYRPSLYEKF